MSQTHCIIFSISAATSVIQNELQALDVNCSLLVLTPHTLFDFEKAELKTYFSGNISCVTFADFISDAEAGLCDEEAYKAGVADNRLEMDEYFADVKRRKNTTIATTLFGQYDIRSGSLLSCDLGIDKAVWVDRGFADLTPIKTPDARHAHKKRPVWRRAASWVIGSIVRKSQAVPELSILSHATRAYLFIGQTSRVWQYFAPQVMKEPILMPATPWLAKLLPGLDRRFRRARLAKILERRGVTTAISSLHEHRSEYHALANELNLKYGVVQDGHIPENYPPFLYLLQCGDAKFYVMDAVAAGMFFINGIPAEVLPLFADRQLPEIVPPPKVGTVLVVTSGAGDWTAVKNRSDDDQMLMAFVEVARAMNDVTFIYRCHPFWVHPTHQGERSILRAADYLKGAGVDNIRISTGSMAQAARYSRDGKLYVESTSLQDEMLMADVVLGEHSYSMIDAARAGKLFASVLIADRRDLFVNYSKLGFFHLTSAQGILNFIEGVQRDPQRVCGIHNSAVRRHNQLCSGQARHERPGNRNEQAPIEESRLTAE